MNVCRTAWVLLIFIAQISAPTFAVKMDATTHDEVIRRLEIGVEDMDKTDAERPGILVRLADLYADRARLKAMNQENPRSDRRQAIRLYQEALPKVEKANQGKIVLQIAHLYSLNEEASKSAQLYKKIAQAGPKAYASEVRALAFANQAEIAFKKGDFKAAKKLFEAAKREDLKNPAFIEYRLAWCELNLGDFKKAVNTLLNASKLSDDATFKADLSSDLARFLARLDNVGLSQIDLLKSVSPDSTRKNNLKLLATETDRLGKKQISMLVWAAYVDEGEVSNDEKLEVQTRVAQINYDMNRGAQAAAAYEKALDLWKKNGCSNAELCEELKTRLRRFVTSWHKSQGKKPTAELFRAYVAYTKVFVDTEMLHWGAQIGSEIGKHKEAIALFRAAAGQAQAEKKQNIFEGSLLGEIEMAEASKDNAAKESAYNFYLSMNPNGAQAFEVRYQRAQLFYEIKRTKDAFNEFHYLASMPGKEHKDLKVKSADLALDCLVAMKDDSSLQVRSLEYARIHPERKAEYIKINRSATMNIVASNLKSERADYKANLAALNTVSLEGADENERIKFYKNKVILAQKAMELGAVQDASDDLLSIRKISDSDREWAMAQKVWAAELQLNFREAYELSKRMKLSHLSKADRELRLALLADLGGLESRKHNENYLRLTNNRRAANLVQITLIKKSSSQWRELEKYFGALKSSPDLLAGITLEVYAGRPNNSKAERILKNSRISQYPAGKTLARHLELKDFHAFNRKISRHRLYGYSDQAMRKTIRERQKLLTQSERNAHAAIKKHDWTLQILSLSQVARENRRFYRDILALPVPGRLNAEQKAQYAQLLKQQSDPYLLRAEKIEAELNQMWNDSNSVQNLQAAYMTASAELQKLYRNEITDLAAVAPSSAQKRLQNLLSTTFRKPSQRDILLARKDVQASPFDISKAQNLRELEAQGGRPAMVVYLDERISQLKKGKSL